MPSKDKSVIAEKNRRYREKNREKMDAASREWIARNRERYNHLQRQYRLRHVDRIKARSAIGRAIRDGKINRGSHCHYCGNESVTQAHHHNGYSREFWLDVIWLCRKCHRVADNADKQK